MTWINLPRLITRYLLCVELMGGIHSKIHVWRSEDICGSQFSPNTVWVVETELKSSGLATSTLTCWAISEPKCTSFWNPSLGLKRFLSGKELLCKHDNWSSNPSTQVKSQVWLYTPVPLWGDRRFTGAYRSTSLALGLVKDHDSREWDRKFI